MPGICTSVWIYVKFDRQKYDQKVPPPVTWSLFGKAGSLGPAKPGTTSPMWHWNGLSLVHEDSLPAPGYTRAGLEQWGKAEQPTLTFGENRNGASASHSKRMTFVRVWLVTVKVLRQCFPTGQSPNWM